VIALIDYGAGNLTSVKKALSVLGAEFVTPSASEELAAVDSVIVPGVGHFAATNTMTVEWRDAIQAAVDRGGAILGICLGMQWLYEGSLEAPGIRGLGLLPGMCVRLPDTNVVDERDGTQSLLKVPHVGWNSLTQPYASTLMSGIAQTAQVYFTHSYVAPLTDATVAVTTHGMPFSAAIQLGRVAGVQFHPEKSGDNGLRILKNWLDFGRWG
jgi:glutamine amidotransferase